MVFVFPGLGSIANHWSQGEMNYAAFSLCCGNRGREGNLPRNERFCAGTNDFVMRQNLPAFRQRDSANAQNGFVIGQNRSALVQNESAVGRSSFATSRDREQQRARTGQLRRRWRVTSTDRRFTISFSFCLRSEQIPLLGPFRQRRIAVCTGDSTSCSFMPMRRGRGVVCTMLKSSGLNHS